VAAKGYCSGERARASLHRDQVVKGRCRAGRMCCPTIPHPRLTDHLDERAGPKGRLVRIAAAMGIGFVFVKLSTLVAMKQSEEAVTGSLRDMDAGAYIGGLARIQKLTSVPGTPTRRRRSSRPNLQLSACPFGLDAAPTDPGLTRRRRWDAGIARHSSSRLRIAGQGPNAPLAATRICCPASTPSCSNVPGAASWTRRVCIGAGAAFRRTRCRTTSRTLA
jgi:hypothetical protein